MVPVCMDMVKVVALQGLLGGGTLFLHRRNPAVSQARGRRGERKGKIKNSRPSRALILVVRKQTGILLVQQYRGCDASQYVCSRPDGGARRVLGGHWR